MTSRHLTSLAGGGVAVALAIAFLVAAHAVRADQLADCATFFSSARLDHVASDRPLHRLTYRVTAGGDARVVRVAALRFVLRPASAAARTEFHAPPTDWRIDSGVPALAA